jgi:hypothetical protein
VKIIRVGPRQREFGLNYQMPVLAVSRCLVSSWLIENLSIDYNVDSMK